MPRRRACLYRDVTAGWCFFQVRLKIPEVPEFYGLKGIAGVYHPDEAWVLEQAEAFKQQLKDENLSCKLLMHDRDTKLTKSFAEAFSEGNRDVRVSAFRSTKTNAYIERFIQTLQQECLDHFVEFGKAHFDHL